MVSTPSRTRASSSRRAPRIPPPSTATAVVAVVGGMSARSSVAAIDITLSLLNKKAVIFDDGLEWGPCFPSGRCPPNRNQGYALCNARFFSRRNSRLVEDDSRRTTSHLKVLSRWQDEQPSLIQGE